MRGLVAAQGSAQQVGGVQRSQGSLRVGEAREELVGLCPRAGRH